MLDGINQSDIEITSILTVQNKFLDRFVCLVLASILVTAGSLAFAAQDENDYLKALESEAADTGTLPEPLNTQSAKTRSGNNPAKANFEKLLKFELPATYKFYTKLASGDQDKVLEIYNQEKKMSAASKLIFDLYFDSTKKNQP